MRQNHSLWHSIVFVSLLSSGILATARAEETPDPTGTWKWERTFQDRTVKSVLKLKLEDGKLAGTYQGFGGEVSIEKGVLEGDEISFQYTRQREGRQFTVKYRGKLNDDVITGNVEILFDDETRQFDWQAKRVVEAADVLGTWTFKIVTDDGQIYEPSLILTREGDDFKGTFHSQLRDVEVEQISLKDNQLTYRIQGMTDDSRVLTATFTGKPRGNSIQGTIDYDLGGEPGAIDFEGWLDPSATQPHGQTSRPTPLGHTTDSLPIVQQRLSANEAVLVDVRELDEWDAGHIAGAIFVPLSQLQSQAEDAKLAKPLSDLLPKDKIAYTHCRSGRRALIAGEVLKTLGYDVRPLKAGYAELLDVGFPKAESDRSSPPTGSEK